MVAAAFVANAESATQPFAAANASAIRKSAAAARIHSGCGISTSETAETAAIFSPEVCTPRSLEGEIDATADHREVILRPVDDAPAQVIGPSGVAGEAKFKTESEMADRFRLSVEVMTLRVNGGKLIR
jgi:hypothetical protein